jgi:hypothetical protein
VDGKEYADQAFEYGKGLAMNGYCRTLDVYMKAVDIWLKNHPKPKGLWLDVDWVYLYERYTPEWVKVKVGG